MREGAPCPFAVSVVVPAFNASATVAASVRSVVGQRVDPEVATLREVVVVDDASTDGGGRLEAALADVDDARVRLVRRPTNGGPAAARMSGVAEATGDVLAFADADDVWLPGKLEAQCRALRARPGVGAVYGWVDVVGPDGEVVFADQRAAYDGDVYVPLLRANFIYSGSNLMVRRSEFDRVGGFNTALRAIEDWELHVRLARVTAFACVPRVLVHYRLRPDSLSGQLDLMEHAFRAARDRVFAEAPPEVGHLRAHASASFYVYLAMRASQQGWRPRSWLAAVRYAALAFRHRPATWLDIVRGASPLAPLRLSLRELLARG